MAKKHRSTSTIRKELEKAKAKLEKLAAELLAAVETDIEPDKELMEQCEDLVWEYFQDQAGNGSQALEVYDWIMADTLEQEYWSRSMNLV